MLTQIGNWLSNWIIGWGGIGALVSIAAWLLWYFTPAILLNFKSLLLHIAVGATVFTIASTYFFTNGYNIGYRVAINAIARKDQAAVDRVKAGQESLAVCRASGGTWDVTTGNCDR